LVKNGSKLYILDTNVYHLSSRKLNVPFVGHQTCRQSPWLGQRTRDFNFQNKMITRKESVNFRKFYNKSEYVRYD